MNPRKTKYKLTLNQTKPHRVGPVTTDGHTDTQADSSIPKNICFAGV